MNLAEFLNSKNDLEESLNVVIQNELDKFREKTGYSVSGLTVDLTDISERRTKNIEYIVKTVRADVAVFINNKQP